MKKVLFVLISLLALVSLFVVVGFTQARGQFPRMYDTKTVETVVGEIVSITQVSRGQGQGGMHFDLKTDKETIAVHLGPTWYLNEQGLKLEAKDKVEVKGSRVTLNNKAVILAAEVKMTDKIIKLRDENGLPLWRGSGRRRGCCP